MRDTRPRRFFAVCSVACLLGGVFVAAQTRPAIRKEQTYVQQT